VCRQGPLRFEQPCEVRLGPRQAIEEGLRVLAGQRPTHLAAEDAGDEALELTGCGVPVLAPRVGVADDQHLAFCPVARHQHEDGVLLIDPGQVEQAAVLAVLGVTLFE
jgi:hypothetical protein